MSRLPRWAPQQKVNGEDLNLLAAALDAGGFLNLQSASSAQTTGQGLTSTVPASPGSTTPPPGTQGAPSTPTGLTVSYGIDNYSQTHDAYVLLTWTPNPVTDYVARYDIYWHKGSDPNLHNLSVGGDVTAARINSLIPGLTYLFAIQAHDAAGRVSNWSMEIPITISLDVDPPAVPTGLAATAIGIGINLTWTEVGSDGISKDLKEYQIAISTDSGGTFPTTRTVGPGNSYFYNPGLGAFAAGVAPTFVFKIASVDWTGNVSAYSSTVSATLNTTLTLNGELEITKGASSGTAPGAENIAQIEWGWVTDAPLLHYQNWLSTQHNGGTAAGNRIHLWTSDGTAAGTFPTNAVLGLTVDNGNVTVPGPAASLQELALSNAGSLVRVSGDGGGRIQLASPSGNTWEIDNNTGILRFFQPGTAYATLTTSAFTLANPLKLVLGTAISKIVPGATSLSLRNNADSADNLILTDAGLATFRNAVTVSSGDLTMTTGNVLGPANFQFNSTGGDVFVSGNSNNSVFLRPTRGSGTGQAYVTGANGDFYTYSAHYVPPSAGGTIATSGYGTVPVKIQEQIQGNVATITFSSIPSGFRHLVVEYTCRSDTAAVNFQELGIRFNNDSGANQYASSRGSLAAAYANSTSLSTGGRVFYCSAAGALANGPGIGHVFIPNYNDTTYLHGARIDWGYQASATFGAGTFEVDVTNVLWNSTAVINRIDFITWAGNFKTGNNIFTLYGIP